MDETPDKQTELLSAILGEQRRTNKLLEQLLGAAMKHPDLPVRSMPTGRGES